MTEPDVQTSPEAEELVNAGAHPVDVDAESLLAEIRKMQAQIDKLNAERGLPSDPVQGAVQNLVHHVKARAAANPTADLSMLQKELEGLGNSPSAKDAERVRNLVADTLDDHGYIYHELAYLERLARDLHTAVLERG